MPPATTINAAAAAQARTTAEPQLGDVLWPLAVIRLHGAEDAAKEVARRFVTADGKQPLLEWLRRQPLLDPDPLEEDESALYARWTMGDLLEDLFKRHDGEQVSEAALQLAVLAYHTATTLQYFRRCDDATQLKALQEYLVELERADTAPDRKALAKKKEGTQEAQLHRHVELLACARRDMTLAPVLAWSSISEVRADAGLNTPQTQVPFPAPPRADASA